MDKNTSNNLNKIFLDSENSIAIHEPNIGLNSYFGKITPVFRNIESFLVEKIKKYPAVVGSVYNVGSKPIAYALSSCERVFLITQNANFHPKYFNKNTWEKSLKWQSYPFQTSLKTILHTADSKWYVEAQGITSTLIDKVEDILDEFFSCEKTEEREKKIIRIDPESKKRLEQSSRGKQIVEALEQYNIGVLLPPIDQLFYKGSVEFPDFTDFAKHISLLTPICIPGTRVLIYSNESIGSSSSALMHHKFVVFLEKIENLFSPRKTPTICPSCGCSLEEPDASFWENIYHRAIADGESLEEAEFLSQETVLQCPHGRCVQQNTFYNPRFNNKYIDVFPDYNPRYKPIAVWTGSFNFTYSAANRHLENGVFVESSDVANIYFHEWAMNFLIAEKLKL